MFCFIHTTAEGYGAGEEDVELGEDEEGESEGAGEVGL